MTAKTIIRLPDDLHAELKAQAVARKSSLNAEMIRRLRLAGAFDHNAALLAQLTRIEAGVRALGGKGLVS